MAELDKEHEALYLNVGYLVVTWGVTEHALDIVVVTIYKELYSKKFSTDKLVQNLSEKLDFLEKCSTILPELAEFRDSITSIRSKFDQTKITRDNIVHGAITDLSMQNGKFIFGKLKRSADKKSLLYTDISFGTDLANTIDIVLNLHIELLELAKNLFDKFGIEKLPFD